MKEVVKLIQEKTLFISFPGRWLHGWRPGACPGGRVDRGVGLGVGVGGRGALRRDAHPGVLVARRRWPRRLS